MKKFLWVIDFIILAAIYAMFVCRTNTEITGWQCWLFVILVLLSRQFYHESIKLKSKNKALSKPILAEV